MEECYIRLQKTKSATDSKHVKNGAFFILIAFFVVVVLCVCVLFCFVLFVFCLFVVIFSQRLAEHKGVPLHKGL